ncbi:MAG: hypothetical protein QOG53_829 [Frankiales bacterium]|nr:hypothetical protein [Frankiales bacterium]
MRRYRFLAVAGAVGAVVLALLPGASSSAVSTASPANTSDIAFDVPRIVDPIHLYGEPDLRVGPDGVMYVSGPQGTGVQRSIWNQSVDNGDSYRLVQDKKIPNDPSTFTAVFPTKSTLGPGGGDTEIIVTRKNRVYYSDLYALLCYTTAYSDNHAKDITSSPEGCSEPGADRQWFGLFDPLPSDHTISPYDGAHGHILYQKYQPLTSGSKVDWAFEDDPNNWHRNDPAGAIATTPNVSPTSASIVVDQHTGDVLTVVGQGDDDGLALAVGVPNNTAPAGTHLTYHYNPIIPSLPGDPSTLFPTITQDKFRNVYVAWVDSASPMNSAHPDKPGTYQLNYMWAHPTLNGKDWTQWHGPYRINKPPSNVNLMPWMEAGRKGIVDVAWYGTDKTLAQLGPDGPSAHKNQVWWTYFAQIDRADTTTPHIVQTRASQHPMHYGDICMLGTACVTATGNRNLADFFQVTIGNDGRGRIVYNDTSNRLVSVLGTVEAIDHPGAAVVQVATQQTGVNALTGQPLSAYETRDPKAGVTDPTGDALFPVIAGSKVSAADIINVALARGDTILRVTVRTKGGALADVARAAANLFGRLVVRWQMGDVLYHAGVEQSVAGGSPTFYAGETKTTDSCSVSACDPHVLDYIAPPLPGAAAATGTAKSGSGGTTYTIDVPLSAVGNPTKTSLLEQVAAYVLVAPTPASFQNTKLQTDADEVPLEVEGARAFNFKAAAVPGGILPPDNAGNGGGNGGGLATTGLPIATPLIALALVAAGLLLRRRRTAR